MVTALCELEDLSGVLFYAEPGFRSLRCYAGAGENGTYGVGNTSVTRALSRHHIPFTYDLDSHDIPVAIKISPDAIGGVLNAKGVIAEEGLFAPGVFTKKPGFDRIEFQPTQEISLDAMKELLSGHGMKYEETERGLVIKDTTSLCAVALSGDNFTGSEQILSENGFSSKARS